MEDQLGINKNAIDLSIKNELRSTLRRFLISEKFLETRMREERTLKCNENEGRGIIIHCYRPTAHTRRRIDEFIGVPFVRKNYQ